MFEDLPLAHPRTGWCNWRVLYDQDPQALTACLADVAWCTSEVITGAAPFEKDGNVRSNDMHRWRNTVGELDLELMESLGMVLDPREHDERIVLSGLGKMPDGRYLLVAHQSCVGRPSIYCMAIAGDHPAIGVIKRRWTARVAELKTFVDRLVETGMLDDDLPFRAQRPY